MHHEILKNELRKSVKNNEIMSLLEELISSYKTKDYFDEILKEYPRYINTKEKGIPIGSLVSQIFANIYLNKLDHYMKDFLRTKYYVRYVDDILVFTDSISEAKNIKKFIVDYSENILRLVVNPKKAKIIKLNKNYFTFLGHRISKYSIKLSKKNISSIRKRKSVYHYADKRSHQDKYTSFLHECNGVSKN